MAQFLRNYYGNASGRPVNDKYRLRKALTAGRLGVGLPCPPVVSDPPETRGGGAARMFKVREGNEIPKPALVLSGHLPFRILIRDARLVLTNQTINLENSNACGVQCVPVIFVR